MTGLALVLVLPCVLTQLLVTVGEHFGFAEVMQSEARDSVQTVLLVCISLAINLAVIIWSQARLLTNFRRMALSGGSA